MKFLGDKSYLNKRFNSIEVPKAPYSSIGLGLDIDVATSQPSILLNNST